MIPLLIACPGIADGLVLIDVEESGDRVTGAMVRCVVCDEQAHVAAGRPGQLLGVSLRHRDRCPLIEMQAALDRGDSRGVRYHRRQALRLLRQKRDAGGN
jgi:hypothetical protein